MKLALILTALAALTACGMTPAEKQALADAAVLQVRALNDAGYDPVNLDAQQLALLSTVCIMSPLAQPAYASDIAQACRVVNEAAQ